jgi:hypothetical protein
MKGLRLEIDPREFRKAEAIFYEEDKNRIVIDAEIMKTDYLTPGLFHEVRHGLNQIKFYDGKFNIFAGYLGNSSKKIDMHYLYKDGFSLDEMVTYGTETFQLVHLWKQNPEGMDPLEYDNLTFTVKTGKILSGWVDRVTAGSMKTVTSVLETENKWKIKKDEILADNHTFPMTVWTNKKDKNYKIELYETNETNLDGKTQYVTAVEIYNGAFSTILQFAKPRSSFSDQQWLAQALFRLQAIQAKSGDVYQSWKDLEVAVSDADIEASARIAGKIRQLVTGE